MSISINSANSVTGQNYYGQTNAVSQTTEDSEALKEVDKLREQMQALESELLQMQSSTDTNALSEDTKEQLEEELEKLKQQLKLAESKAVSSSNTSSSVSSSASSSASSSLSFKPRFDKYEKSIEESQSSGIYTVKLNGEKGYDISYEPYSESKGEDASVTKEGQSEEESLFESNYTES